jgi:N-acetylneuraminate synthase
MASINLRDNFVLSDFGSPYIVAELNTSHFGSLDLAKQMVLEAKNIGCHCVKFQSWSANSLYSQTYYDENPIAKRFVDKFSFSEIELKEIASYCEQIGISFASTPYSKGEVDFLINKCKVPFIKIASMDLNNHPYLEYIANTGVPIILSTGMSEMDEIHQAVKIIEATKNVNLCILHCVSIYPVENHLIHLNNILGLRKSFPNYPIGFSDHSIGIEMPIASVALGACLIEKHFTLDKSKIGMDNQMATEPGEMRDLIQSCQNVQVALGSKARLVSEDELEQRLKMRRSIVSSRPLKAGTVLTAEDLAFKRPGTGYPPGSIGGMIGKKLVNDLKEDVLILSQHLA